MKDLGLAGKIARSFIDSKLTPLVVAAALLLGLFATVMTPREEEPQIVVPMIDIYLPLPGATPQEVQERVVKPFESKIWEIKGVEYLYSMSRPGMGIITVRFLVGEPMEESLVKLYNKVMSNRPILPPGAGEPLVSPKSIDDVPILAATVWSDRYDHATLRTLALELADELKKSDNSAEVEIRGGISRQLKVTLDAGRLAGYGISPLQVAGVIQKGNASTVSGSFSGKGQETIVQSGSFLDGAESVKRLVTGVYGGKPVYLSDVARVEDSLEEPSSYVFMGKSGKADLPAVTISLAKRKGANATWVADDMVKKIESLKGILSPGLIGSFVLLGVFPLVAKKIIDMFIKTSFEGGRHARRVEKIRAIEEGLKPGA